MKRVVWIFIILFGILLICLIYLQYQSYLAIKPLLKSADEALYSDSSSYAYPIYNVIGSKWPLINILPSYQEKKNLALKEFQKINQKKPAFVVFLKDDISSENLKLIMSQLEKSSNLIRINYISKEQALEIYRQANKDNPVLLKLVTSEVLPASVTVYLVDRSKARTDSELVKDIVGVEEIVFLQVPKTNF